MRITKSILKKIIKEEILKEMMGPTFDKKQNKRLALIRKALTDNEDFSNEIDNLTQNEWQYIQRLPPVQDIEPLFQKLESNETVYPGQITPKEVKALISLAEKPNLRRLIMPLYKLVFESAVVSRKKPNLLRIIIKPAESGGGSFERLRLILNKSTNEVQRLNMPRWTTPPASPKRIGFEFAFDDELKYIEDFNGESVFFQKIVEKSNPIYQAYLSGKKTKEIVDKLEKELGAEKAFEELRSTVWKVDTNRGYGPMVYLGIGGDSLRMQLDGLGLTLPEDWPPEETRNKLPPVESVVPQVLLKYVPHNLHNLLQDDNPLKEKK